ncbi:uncharacterized protein LOC142255930 [Anomaloglossus baeobatrachus]|uniref:uncharacterized protein LOC142255930 n=1 Tax=Anomaloglossus baeobatrachus TaxID=238106 RepID=UPI003F50B998
MKNLVALLCMVSALVGSVFSHKCYSGMSRMSKTCNVTENECLGDRCMTISQHIFNDGMQFWSIMKGCANETVCGANTSEAAAEKIKFQFHSNCCSGEFCNTDEYYLPPVDPTPNGAKCPTCYCSGILEECKCEKVMNCTGSMDHCFDYRQHMVDTGERDEKFSIKGCINPAACKINFKNNIGVNVKESKMEKCYNPRKSNNLQ